MIRLTVHFSGRVQGVGFRYTTLHIARRHPVAGFVQNLPDGRVLLVAEGQADDVRALVDQVSRQMNGFVQDQLIDESPATGEFGTPGVDPLILRR